MKYLLKPEKFPEHHDLGARGFKKVVVLRQFEVQQKCKTCNKHSRRNGSAYCESCAVNYNDKR